MASLIIMRKTFRISVTKLLNRWVQKPVLKPSDIDTSQIQRILIISHSDTLKDLLLSTPVFRAARQHFPNSHISLLADSKFSPVLQHNVYSDEVIAGLKGWSLMSIFSLLKKLRSGFDLVINLNTSGHSLRNDILAWSTGAKYVLCSEHLVLDGCDENFFYNLRAPYASISVHQAERNLDIVRFLGMNTTDFREEIFLTQQEKDRAVEFLKEQGASPRDFLLAVHIGGEVGDELWTSHQFVKIAKFFSSDHNAKLILSWGMTKIELGQEVVGGLPFQPIVVNSLNYRERAAVLFFCNLMICEHCDLMHLAASVGIPIIGLYGKSDPHEWKPIGKQIIALKVAAAMATISVGQVIEKAQVLLQFYPKSARLNFDNFEISDQVVDTYLHALDR